MAKRRIVRGSHRRKKERMGGGIREAKGGGGEMRFAEGVKRRWRLGSRDRRGENTKQAVTED